MGNNWILTSHCDCRANYGLFNTKLHDSPTLLGSKPFIYWWSLNRLYFTKLNDFITRTLYAGDWNRDCTSVNVPYRIIKSTAASTWNRHWDWCNDNCTSSTNRTNIWWGCLKRIWMACDFLRIDSIFSILVSDGTLGDSNRRISEETTIQLYGVCDIRDWTCKPTNGD